MEAVHGLMHVYRAQQARLVREATQELTPLEGRVLHFFARHPDATQSDLAAHSGRDKGQLARLVGSLRERGLLQAQPDAADRRNLRLRLTPAGEAMHAVFRRQAKRLSTLAARGLDSTERAQLLALLGRMQANLESAG